MALKIFKIFFARKFTSDITEYVSKLPNRPKPVIADFYTTNKEHLAGLLQGLNGRQTLMKIIETYKDLGEIEKKHLEAFRLYQKELEESLLKMPPNIQSQLITLGYVKNPVKIFKIHIPKIPSSPYAYYTQIKMKTNPNEKNPSPQEVMSTVARDWKNMPKAEKLEYVQQWDNLKETFKQQMDNWKDKMLSDGYSKELVELLSKRRNRKIQDESLSLESLKKATKGKTMPAIVTHSIKIHPKKEKTI